MASKKGDSSQKSEDVAMTDSSSVDGAKCLALSSAEIVNEARALTEVEIADLLGLDDCAAVPGAGFASPRSGAVVKLGGDGNKEATISSSANRRQRDPDAAADTNAIALDSRAGSGGAIAKVKKAATQGEIGRDDLS